MNLKVLIVDDDDIILFLHDLMIRESGLSSTPLSFENGLAALNYLNDAATENGHYLVFLDINMPVMNGWEFLEAIHASLFKERVSVVMVTSSIDLEDRDKAKKYPEVIDYVEKPLSVEICERISKSLPF